MPPRVKAPSGTTRCLSCNNAIPRRRYAIAAVSAASQTIATMPAATISQMAAPPHSIPRHPPTQPPSLKPPEHRNSQLLRQYTALLRSTPLMLVFQHNNIAAHEWVAIRRELSKALQKVDQQLAAALSSGADAVGSSDPSISSGIKLEVVKVGLLDVAMKLVEFYKPESPGIGVGGGKASGRGEGEEDLSHSLSASAHDAVARLKRKHGLSPLMSGPVALLTFPDVSPQHLRAALTVLAPRAPQFPAPTRRANPGYYDTPVQEGLQKLMLLAARVEGSVFDAEGTRWVGGIEGGLSGLRGQLVALLQGIGAGVTNTLETASKNVYFTLEGRRTSLEEEGKTESGKGGE